MKGEKKNFLTIMTPFCIFAINAGDKRCPLSNVTRLTLQPALEGCKLFIHIKVTEFHEPDFSVLRRVPKKRR